MPANDNHKYERIGDIVSMFKRGRTWYANFQHNGRQKRKSLKTGNKKEARRQALILEAELQQGRYSHPVQPPTIEQAVEEYMKYAETEGRAAKTLVKYREVFDRALALAEELNRKVLPGLDLTFVDEYRHRRVEAGRAPKTIYNETMILRQLVNFALSRGMLDSDPLSGLKIKEPTPAPQPCWTPQEIDRILEASREPHRWAFAILAETGMRVGELRWLTWDDVDFPRNVLHIRPKEGWRPKTGDRRAIPLSPTLRRLLEELPRTGRWVLTAPPSPNYPRGGRQISERRLLKHLKRVLGQLGLEGHLHTFRHAFISRALTAGVPEAVVRSWVGHVDRDILRLYTHIADADSQSAMERLDEARDVSETSQNEEASDATQDDTDVDSAHFQHRNGGDSNEDGAK